MKTVIVVRSCPDYSQLSEDTFHKQLGDPYKPRSEMRWLMENNVFALWAKRFCLPYFSYREEIAKIAQQSVQETGCQVLRGRHEFINWYNQDTEDCFIAPIDDDDWFSPELKEIKDGCDLYIWKNTILENTKAFTFKIDCLKGLDLGSNHWAVRKSYLKTLDDDVAKGLLLFSHVHAAKFFEYNLPRSKVCIVDKQLSVYHKHPACLSQFYKNLHPEILIKDFAKQKVVMPHVPENLVWSKEYTELAYLLNVKLRGMHLLC